MIRILKKACETSKPSTVRRFFKNMLKPNPSDFFISAKRCRCIGLHETYLAHLPMSNSWKSRPELNWKLLLQFKL